MWMNDFALVDKLGDWWLNDLDLEQEADAVKVEMANAALEERGVEMTVLEVRPLGDILEWLVEE